MEEIICTVNGIPQRIIADPNKSVIKVLREDLRLTGTKEGCAAGHCGTCAVLVDGGVVLGCKYPISRARDKHITTIEGIGTPTNPHPLQIAFAQGGAVQCGFCIPGMIVRAKALLDKTLNPRREEIINSIQPHLCRCTGYQKIFEAVESAAAYMRGEIDAPKPKPAEITLIGQAVIGQDALFKSTGVTLFGDDLRVDGCNHIKVVRSPHHHARIMSIDKSEALSLPGVLAILTAKDIKGTNILKIIGDDQPVLCVDKVRMIGDPVAAVVGITEDIATQAARRVKIIYEELRPVLTIDEAMKKGAPQVHGSEPNIFFERKIISGDIEQGFHEADVLIEEDYSTQTVEHGYLERDTGLAYIHENGQLVVMTGSQNIYGHRQAIAEAVGVVPDQVRVIQTVTGGAFGGKIDVSVGGILAAAALALGRPVKLVYTREETFAATTKRHPFLIKGRVGAKKDGTFTALQFDVLADAGAYKSESIAVMSRGSVHAGGPYRFQNTHVIGRMVFTNTAVKGAMRGFGAPQYMFALESMIDGLCDKLKIDPLEIRVKNGYVGGDRTITGQRLEGEIGFIKCIDHMKSHYARAVEEARRFSTDLLKRGVGLGCVMFATGSGVPDISEAWAEILPDGRLKVSIGAADMGQGSDTVFWQIAAETMGYSLERVVLCTTDTGRAPDGGLSAGSRQTYVSGKAVQKAVVALKKLMDDNGCRTYADLQAKGLPVMVKLVHQTETERLDAEGHGKPYETYAFGVQMAEVEVDIKTGRVKVLKVTAAMDAGRVINKLGAEGQAHGGIVQGLGYALTEEYRYPETNNFVKFRMPRAKDAPGMDVYFVESPRKNGPFGACGMAESVLVPTAPAIANAVYNACGARVRDLPITPEKVKSELVALEKVTPPG
jgi:aldehyde oxidoreductase